MNYRFKVVEGLFSIYYEFAIVKMLQVRVSERLDDENNVVASILLTKFSMFYLPLLEIIFHFEWYEFLGRHQITYIIMMRNITFKKALSDLMIFLYSIYSSFSDCCFEEIVMI
jgi:hypothetical protein